MSTAFYTHADFPESDYNPFGNAFSFGGGGGGGGCKADVSFSAKTRNLFDFGAVLSKATSPQRRRSRKRKAPRHTAVEQHCDGISDEDEDDGESVEGVPTQDLPARKCTPSPRHDHERRHKPNALAALMAGAKCYFSGVFSRGPFNFSGRQQAKCEKCKDEGLSIKCSHCDRYFCDACIEKCEGCNKSFCSVCTTSNYDASETRIFCLDCDMTS